MTAGGGDFAFLICSERSGSNFVTKLLDAHPDVCGPSPTHVIRTFAPNLWRYGDLERDDNWRALCGDVADYLACQLGVWRTSWSAADLASAAADRTLAALVGALYRGEAAAHGASRIVVKENHTARLTPFLLAWFPAARYLYMVRDPRDMALSVKLSPATRGRVHRAAELWLADQRASLEVYGMLAATGRILLTRYEDLVSDPEPVSAAVCDFLGVPFAPDMLAFHEHDLTAANAARVDAWRNLAKPILRDNHGKYRTGLSELEVRYVEARCGAEMEYFGYGRDHPPGDVDELAAALERVEQAEPEPREGAVSPAEQAVRQRRLAVIERVLGRHNAPPRDAVAVVAG